MSKKFEDSVRISKRVVDSAEPAAERYVVWDSDLRGFGLRVSPSGTKTYVVRYRFGGGRSGVSRQLVIGRHGPLTPEQARKQAAAALGAVALGSDPQADRAESRAELTMSELCDLYLREGCTMKKASTVAIDKIRVARHIKPLLGRKRLSDIKRADIERFQSAVANGQTKAESTPHTRGGKAAATRSVGLLGGIFSFAVNRGLCSSSPVAGVRRFKDNKRERFLSAVELGRLGDALIAFEADGMAPEFVTIIRLLALTGARKNEIASMRRSEVDLDRGYLRLQESKTGAKVIPLGAAALEVLSKLDDRDDYLFPDPRDPSRPIRGLDWAWVRVRTRAGLPEVRIHDLRHSFASFGLAGGQSLSLIGKLLGHAHIATTHRYTHLADDPVRAAADAIAATVSGAMNRQQAEVRSLATERVRS